MVIANRFVQPMDYYGTYGTNSWAGYVFREALGYTSGVHTGVDYNGAGAGNADLGMEARAVANGIVRWVGNRNDLGFGNTIIIEHPLAPTYKAELGCDSLFSRYMHLNTIEVAAGQQVTAGQRIGSVGNTGTQWAHLHLDLYKSTIDGGGVHFRYDKNTQLASYLDAYRFVQTHQTAVDTGTTLLGYQRQVSNTDGINGRSAPNTSASIVKEYGHGEVLDFKGFVKGQDPYGAGNNIWFVGRYSDTYWYSGAFTDRGTHDLANLTPAPTPPPAPTPTPEPTYTFSADLLCVTEVKPAAIGNFEYENFPSAPTKIVLHDFGLDGRDTYTTTVNEFARKGTEKSVHFVVSKNKITQMVALKDRAYHATAVGNVYIGIESDPAQDKETIASVKKLIAELEAKYGYDLPIIKHSSIVATQCGDDIDLLNYVDPVPAPAPQPEPAPTPTPSDPRIDEIEAGVKQNSEKLNAILALLQSLWAFVTRTFK